MAISDFEALLFPIALVSQLSVENALTCISRRADRNYPYQHRQVHEAIRIPKLSELVLLNTVLEDSLRKRNVKCNLRLL